MKRIVLAGKFNSFYNDLHKALVNRFEVQMCSDNAELLAGILKMSRQDAILVSVAGAEESYRDLFSCLDEMFGRVPVVCIGNDEEFALIESFPGTAKFKKLTRPVSTEDIAAALNESMGITAQKDPVEALRRSRRPTGKSADRQPEGRKKILLVDDAAISLRTMQGMLKKNYDVMMATSGQEAVRVIRKSRPDLILLDYDMPNCDGRETFEKIRNEENGEDVPVVFVTGVKEKERIMPVLKLKPEGYLIKPVKQSDLMELVKQVLGQ